MLTRKRGKTRQDETKAKKRGVVVSLSLLLSLSLSDQVMIFITIIVRDVYVRTDRQTIVAYRVNRRDKSFSRTFMIASSQCTYVFVRSYVLDYYILTVTLRHHTATPLYLYVCVLSVTVAIIINR